MSTDDNSPNEGNDVEAIYRSYPEIVWRQFKNYPFSYAALYGLGILVVLAMIAPIIAMNVPFYLYVPEGVGPAKIQGVSFPWFWALFDINFFENNVDIFFNLLLFSLPLNLLIWFGIRPTDLLDGDAKAQKEYKQFRMRFILGSILLQVAAIVAMFWADFQQPYVDYVKLADKEGVQAIFPFFEYSYRDVNLMTTSLEPSWEHWLGTDRQGRDVLTRILYGTRISLTIGVVAMTIATTIGMFIGALGGYFGGWVDMICLRLIEVFLVFPAFYLILTLRGFIEEPSVFYVMGIIGIVYWTGIARLVRGEFLRLRNEDFVQAAQALGLPEPRIIFRHVMPNALGPVLVSVTFGIAGAILFEAVISFLGVGDPTAPSWGQILKGGDDTGRLVLMIGPGVALFITITILNLIGEGIRDAMDPKLRN
ncbi:MAG: ABC transporter permease [Bradymonadaceae bacterium]